MLNYFYSSSISVTLVLGLAYSYDPSEFKGAEVGERRRIPTSVFRRRNEGSGTGIRLPSITLAV